MNIYEEVRLYLIKNKEKPINEIYKELQKKKKKTKAEYTVYTYLKINKKKLGIK